MSYEQFWYGNAKLYWAYRTAFIKSKEIKVEEENHFAWLQGLYMYKAFATVEYNINKGKSDPLESYFEKPIDFSETKDDIINIEQTKLENRMKAYIESKKIKLDMKGKK